MNRLHLSGAALAVLLLAASLPLAAPVPEPRPRERVAVEVHPPYSVHWLAYSPDGNLFATACHDGLERLHDAANGKCLAECEGHKGPVDVVAFSPDSKLVASAGVGSGVRVWAAPGGKELAAFRGRFQLAAALAFSPDGKTLVGGCEDGLHSWEMPTRKEQSISKLLCLGEPNSLLRVADGRLLVASLASRPEDAGVQVWDMKAETKLAEFADAPTSYSRCAISADGRLLALGFAKGTCSVYVGDIRTGKKIAAFKHPPQTIDSIALSPDGKLLATGYRTDGVSDSAVRLVDVATGEVLAVYKNGHKLRGINCVAFSPDGLTLASAGGDGVVNLWPVPPRQTKEPK